MPNLGSEEHLKIQAYEGGLADHSLDTPPRFRVVRAQSAWINLKFLRDGECPTQKYNNGVKFEMFVSSCFLLRSKNVQRLSTKHLSITIYSGLMCQMKQNMFPTMHEIEYIKRN